MNIIQNFITYFEDNYSEPEYGPDYHLYVGTDTLIEAVNMFARKFKLDQSDILDLREEIGAQRKKVGTRERTVKVIYS